MRVLALSVAIIVLATLPLFADRGIVFLGTEFLVILVMAQAWNLLAGYGGLLSLGHHAFVGLGGYALFAITRDLPIHPYLAVPLAGLVAGVVALALAPILFRLREVYFAVGMWVAAEVLRILVTRWDYVGGAMGLPLYAARSLDRNWVGPSTYWLALMLAIVIFAIVWRLMSGTFGLRLMALRDDELAARSIGVAPWRVRITVFLISAIFVGMAGAVQFLASLYITPTAGFDMNWMVTIVFVTIIGGIGHVWGPVFGTLLFFALREALAFSSSWYLVALGATAMVVMLFFPRGLAGLAERFVSTTGAQRKKS